MGCDSQGGSPLQIYAVSIHAPTWGATAGGAVAGSLIAGFQSTHPHGVRLSLRHNLLFNKWFQSTHPHGVRRGIGCSYNL